MSGPLNDPAYLSQLLKETVRLQESSGGGGASEAPKGPLSAEDKTFLENAFREGTVNVPERLKDLIAVVRNANGDHSDDDRLAALDETMELVEIIDFASDYHKLGGLEMLRDLVVAAEGDADADAEVVGAAIEVVATAVQHNPFCQKAAQELGILALLCRLVEHHPAALVRKKAWLAIACLVRDSTELQQQLVAAGGAEALHYALTKETVAAIRRRAVGLLRSIWLHGSEPGHVAASLNWSGFVEPLVDLIGFADDIDVRELVAELLGLLLGADDAATVLRSDDLGLKSKAAARAAAVADGEREKELLEALAARL